MDFLNAHYKGMSHNEENCYTLLGFPNKVAHVSKFEKGLFDEKYKIYLRLKSEKFNNQGQSSSEPSISTSIFSFVDRSRSMNTWLGASDDVYGTKCSFSVIPFPKAYHFVIVGNGSKFASQGICQVALSPSLNLDFFLYIPYYPYN